MVNGGSSAPGARPPADSFEDKLMNVPPPEFTPVIPCSGDTVTG